MSKSFQILSGKKFKTCVVVFKYSLPNLHKHSLYKYSIPEIVPTVTHVVMNFQSTQ